MDFRAAYFRLYAEMATAVEEMQTGQHKKALARMLLAQLNEEENYVQGDQHVGIAFPGEPKDGHR